MNPEYCEDLNGVTVSCGASPAYKILTINVLFEWPSKLPLYIELNGLVNPNVATTKIFQAFSSYDSKVIDQTDKTDLAL
jgi:hypothetical protein